MLSISTKTMQFIKIQNMVWIVCSNIQSSRIQSSKIKYRLICSIESVESYSLQYKHYNADQDVKIDKQCFCNPRTCDVFVYLHQHAWTSSWERKHYEILTSFIDEQLPIYVMPLANMLAKTIEMRRPKSIKYINTSMSSIVSKHFIHNIHDIDFFLQRFASVL